MRENRVFWEYSYYFKSSKEVASLEGLSPLFPRELTWNPLDMLWREGGRNELDLLFQLYPSQESLLEDRIRRKPIFDFINAVGMIVAYIFVTALSLLSTISVWWLFYFFVMYCPYIMYYSVFTSVIPLIFLLGASIYTFKLGTLRKTLRSAAQLGGMIGAIASACVFGYAFLLQVLSAIQNPFSILLLIAFLTFVTFQATKSKVKPSKKDPFTAW